MSDDATLVLTDIKAALASANKEAEDKPAALLVVGGELNGTLFDLTEQELTVGRSAKCEIPLEFNGISREHFKLNATEEGYNVEDLGSRNGTFLNNSKIEAPTELQKGDIIKMGAIALKYLPKGDPERLTYDKLQLEANTDGLTSCYNKSYFNKKLDLEVKKSKVTGTPLSLIVFDLDHFKKLNDNYGHDAGDYVLKELAEVIRTNGIRETDIFARYGGEEFVVLLPKTNIKQSYEIAERLRKAVETHDFIYDDNKLPVTASIGVSDYRQGVSSGTDLFKRADAAVYKSKEGGRNQVNFYRD
ncbi:MULTISPECIES: GGDEF domain-containing protein [Halobacteriovorax]|uniref:diguanylate cyclase n=1 Tax=Halobacteriovorax vibrionivorans TaxID=2152716 RepID=A0ABY0IJA0_9BACT|nr:MULTISPECIES: GGDEF domain-containing protein [Halobacteriovorax]AYF45498.1 diguanylate cyclase (GGDEF) domain protein [Halobacteriovorax sp. BALOs_7]RZF22564.1 GGDEF domain-containing protein [Halobacteriovorax vibrionivorans]TGD47757.1 GGDEF domain-containing protein [Halobacteriovorax sp. Y22]